MNTKTNTNLDTLLPKHTYRRKHKNAHIIALTEPHFRSKTIKEIYFTNFILIKGPRAIQVSGLLK